MWMSLRGAAVVVVDRDHPEQLNSSPGMQLPAAKPSDLLYVVFTWESGMPSGAIVNHSNFSSAVYHQQKPLQIYPKSRVFDFAS